MVFNPVISRLFSSNQKSDYDSKSSGLPQKRIFTCAEIEAGEHKEPLAKKINSMKNNIKHVDSSIVHFSSSKNDYLTRYGKVDLLALRLGKLSQQPPRCYYDPRIIRLNILTFKNQEHTEDIENQMKLFREKLQNLTLSSWDPNLLQLLKNYHNALLNPFYNNYLGNYQQQQQQHQQQQQQQQSVPNPAFNGLAFQHQQPFPPPPKVSFVDQQQAVLDKIPSYDRNMNFFDNITTTATMRPPRMGVNSFSSPNSHTNGAFHKRSMNRKPNTCSSERHSTSYGSSVGYFSGNETRSSYDDIGSSDKAMEKTSGFIESKRAECLEKLIGDDRVEEEPEWFNVPASINDFVELHGFDDDIESEQKAKGNEHEKKNPIVPNQPYRRSNYNQQQPQYRHNNNNNSNRNVNYRQNPTGQVNNNSNYNQRFRNPLHYAPNHIPNRTINPFFEAWKNGKCLNQPNVSFSQLMEQSNTLKNLPSNCVNINDVESEMKRQQNVNRFNSMPNVVSPSAVPLFFQNLASNWGVRVKQQQDAEQMPMNAFPMPTQEQLQQHTSEIMRNAILRKNQQYHDEKLPRQ